MAVVTMFYKHTTPNGVPSTRNQNSVDVMFIENSKTIL